MHQLMVRPLQPLFRMQVVDRRPTVHGEMVEKFHLDGYSENYGPNNYYNGTYILGL